MFMHTLFSMRRKMCCKRSCMCECVWFLDKISTYRIHEENMRCSSQVKPHPSSFEWQEHDGRAVGRRALKLLDDLGPLLLAHGAVQTHKTETVLSGEEDGEQQCQETSQNQITIRTLEKAKYSEENVFVLSAEIFQLTNSCCWSSAQDTNTEKSQFVY